MHVRPIILSVLCCSLLVQGARAADVVVTLDFDQDRIQVGQTARLSVLAQVFPSTQGDGLFAWGLDLAATDAAIADMVADSVLSSGWDDASSHGQFSRGRLEAMYNTSFMNAGKGVSEPVELFSVDILGLAPGITTIQASGNPIQGDDFVTHLGYNDDQGIYSNATATINVEPIPEPLGISLLGLGSLALLRRRNRTRFV